MYMTFQEILMTGGRDIDKNNKNAPWLGLFPHMWPQKSFFKNRALSLSHSYGALSSYKKLGKTNWPSLRYFQTDQRTNGPTDRPQTGKSDYIGPLWINQRYRYRTGFSVFNQFEIYIFRKLEPACLIVPKILSTDTVLIRSYV